MNWRCLTGRHDYVTRRWARKGDNPWIRELKCTRCDKRLDLVEPRGPHALQRKLLWEAAAAMERQ